MSVNVFSWKILIDKMGNVFLGLQLETKENCHFTRASEPRKGCSAKVVPSFLSYFNTLSIGLTLGIEQSFRFYGRSFIALRFCEEQKNLFCFIFSSLVAKYEFTISLIKIIELLIIKLS